MSGLEFTSKIIAAVLSWPVAVALVAFWQREAIGRLIDRIQSFRGAGVEVDTTKLEVAARDAVDSKIDVNKVVSGLSSAVSAGGGIETRGAETRAGAGYSGAGGRGPALVADVVSRLAKEKEEDERRRREAVRRLINETAQWGWRFGRRGAGPPDLVIDWDGDDPQIIGAWGG